MPTLRALSLLPLIALVGCVGLGETAPRGVPAPAPPEPLALSEEERAVYAAAVAYWMEGSEGPRRVDTVTRSSARRITRHGTGSPDYARFSPAPQEAVADFLARNERTFEVGGGFDLPEGAAFHPDGEGPLLALSRIGFDGERAFAVVEVAEIRGPLNAMALYLILERQAAGWHVVRVVGAWLS